MNYACLGSIWECDVHESWRAGFGPLWLLDMNNGRISEYRSRVARKVRYMINANLAVVQNFSTSHSLEACQPFAPAKSLASPKTLNGILPRRFPTHHTSNYTASQTWQYQHPTCSPSKPLLPSPPFPSHHYFPAPTSTLPS